MAAGFAGERQFSWRAFSICLVISLSVMGFGYPTAILGTTLSQPSFLTYMHLIDEDGKPTPSSTRLIGSTNGVYQVRACSDDLAGASCDALVSKTLGFVGRRSYWHCHHHLDDGQVWAKEGLGRRQRCRNHWCHWLYCVPKHCHVYCFPRRHRLKLLVDLGHL